MENNNEYTLMAINELYRELEKTNAKVRRVKFTNKVYFALTMYWAWRLFQESKKEEKEQNE